MKRDIEGQKFIGLYWMHTRDNISGRKGSKWDLADLAWCVESISLQAEGSKVRFQSGDT